ncbi:MAG: YrdB family protein [Pseudonocardiales bacterium]
MTRPDDTDGVPEHARLGYLIAETVAFVSELLLLGTLVVVGYRLGTGGLISIAMAALYPALGALIWALWVAPKAARRLEDPWRLITQVTLFLVTGALAVITGLVVWGVVLAAVGVGAFVAARVIAR